MNLSGLSLFQKIQFPVHCLNLLWPSDKDSHKKVTTGTILGTETAAYVLPQCHLNTFERSFIN